MPVATKKRPARTRATASQETQNLVTVRNLRISFDQQGRDLEVVKGVSFRIAPGSTVALVGESGAGKSVIGQAIMGILPTAARVSGGEILFSDPRDGTVPDGVEFCCKCLYTSILELFSNISNTFHAKKNEFFGIFVNKNSLRIQ